MDKDRLQLWLVTRIADIVGCDSSDIDVRRRFDRMGLDSMSLIGLAAEVEEYVGEPVDAETLIDHRTVESLCKLLSD